MYKEENELPGTSHPVSNVCRLLVSAVFRGLGLHHMGEHMCLKLSLFCTFISKDFK